MPHFATTNNTQQYSMKFPALKYNTLGATQLTVSPAGFGSYRVHVSVDSHRQALRQALENGINLVDTSSNYADGGSEELIGSVISELNISGKIKREQIVIISKAGYLQGQNFALSQQLKAQGNPYPDLVEYGQGLEHCIHPRFLEDQLTRSLKRLNMETIDVYLLHNPEYYLLWAHNNGLSRSEAEKEFYRRIEQAFLHLEIEVQNGRIQYYGISSNTFPLTEKMYGFSDLSRIWDIAQSLSGDHKFKVIQFPLNLLEKGAICEINQSTRQSLIDFAADKSLGILINRPLNAFSNNQLSRLVSIEINEKLDQQHLQEKFKQVAQLEDEFADEILTTLKLDESKQKELSGLFSSGIYLKSTYQTLGPYWSWLENQARYLTDQVSYGIQLVNEVEDKSQKVVKWLDDYVQHLNDLLGSLTLYYGEIAATQNNKILENFKNSYASFSDFVSLQQVALAALFSNKHISSTLVGMRRAEYIRDVLNTLEKSSAQTIEQSFWG